MRNTELVVCNTTRL